MAISDKIDRLASGIERATDSLRHLNDEIDRAASTEFTLAPASFAPPPAPGPPGTPSNPLPPSPFAPLPLPTPRLFAPDGSTVRTSSSGSSTGSGSQVTLADNPLIPSMTPGAILLYKSDLEGFLASGMCQLMDLPSGGQVISCPWGLYPGLSGGVLSSTSGQSSGGSSSSSGTGSGTGGLDFEVSTGNQDRRRRQNPNVTNNPTGRQFGPSASSTTGPSAPSSVQLDSRPITDRLDGLRRDVQTLASSLAGDGGAGIRFHGGL